MGHVLLASTSGRVSAVFVKLAGTMHINMYDWFMQNLDHYQNYLIRVRDFKYTPDLISNGSIWSFPAKNYPFALFGCLMLPVCVNMRTGSW